MLDHIKYLGNKSRHIEYFNSLLVQYRGRILVDVFAGSGVIALNAPQTYCIINDIDANLMQIHNDFKHLPYSLLMSIQDELKSFGNPWQNKSDYYAARAAMNKKYFKTDEPGAGFYFTSITEIAVNSMMRFGPNGFNQGFGNRGSYGFDAGLFEKLQRRYSTIQLTQLDAFELIEHCAQKPHLYVLFVDPPYVNSNAGTYFFTPEMQSKLHNLIKSIDMPVLYTDVFEQSTIKGLGESWRWAVINDHIGNAKPGKKVKDIKEALYFNNKLL